MRDIINKLDTILLEKARGLLYRDKGDEFFQGARENPTAELVFDKVEYFPQMPGEYSSYECPMLARICLNNIRKSLG
jgi:hypothetical protein